MEAIQITPHIPAPANWSGNGMVAGAAAAIDRAQDRADRADALVGELATEFMQALQAGPRTAVWTPGFHAKHTRIDAVIEDQLDTPHGRGDAYREQLVALFSKAMNCSDASLKAAARTLASQMSLEHANWHAADAATALEG